MADRSAATLFGAVVVIETNARHRLTLEQACRRVGIGVRGVSSVSELEQWPTGQIVITDREHLTPWWQLIGAAEVIALVHDAQEGSAVLATGATQWMPLTASADAVAAMVLKLDAGRSRGNVGPSCAE